MRHYACLAALLTAFFLSRAEPGGMPEKRTEPTARLRRPTAAVESNDSHFFFIANRRSGTVSVLDLHRRQPTAEFPVGRSLVDLAPVSGGHFLLAVDENKNELIVLAVHGHQLAVRQRLKVSADPVSVRVSPDGKRATVASRWAHCLTVLDLDRAGHARPTKVVALPFAPRQQVLAHGKTIVADAFGGRLAVIDLNNGKLESCRTVPGHNIRGLVIGPDKKSLWLAQQILHPHARTTIDDIHWGNVVTNNLRRLSLKAVLTPAADVLKGSQLFELGDVGHGAGDPGSLTFSRDGRAIVPLGGTAEVALGSPDKADCLRLSVGHEPTAVILSHQGTQAFVVNTLDDSIAVLDLASRKIAATIPLGPPAALTAADRGELLFHDAHLAHEGWYSCQSCHTDGHTNGQLNDNLTDGSYGTPKRVLSLLGIKDTAPYAWNGGLPDLSAQIRRSVETTMRGQPLSPGQVRDLEAYLRTLTPPPPRPIDEAARRRGRKVFEARRCQRCHQPPTYTSAGTYDVGLVDEAGQQLFNPPSLRGVGQGTAFFHDGRAATLDEVFTRYRHELHGTLAPNDLVDLLAFLRSL